MPPAVAPPRPATRAAQYLRMSKEQQRYSPENQALAIDLYAKARGYEVVRTYADHGLSGVSIAKRKGLKQLLADVLGGEPDFGVILVYDVSRWGRFQNPDQSAHYEFLCTEAGVQVEYCAEMFENDHSLASTLVKNLKRSMAAEYSRDLSVKVRAGRLNLQRKGFWMGGRVGYGLRRQMLDAEGRPVMILEWNQAKALQDHHNIVVPGPAEEIAVVQRIYHLFAYGGVNRTAIAARLNREGVASEAGSPWTFQTVTQVLENPKYVGEVIINRFRSQLGGPPVRTDPASWERLKGYCAPIVDKAVHAAAQRRLANRPSQISNARLLEIARKIHASHGRLSYGLLATAPGAPLVTLFKARFGGVEAVAAAIGHPMAKRPRKPRIRLEPEEALRRLAELLRACGHLSSALISRAPNLPNATTYAKLFGSLAEAYALIGFVPMTAHETASPVGRARQAAAAIRSERFWAKRAEAEAPGGA